MSPKLKKKKSDRNVQKTESDDDVVEISVDSAVADPAEAKDSDFDLDLDSAQYEGKKGQAGSRTKN